MQVTETGQDGLKHEFTVVIEANDIKSKVDDRLAEIGRQARIPGFRPGKIPPKVLKQRYGHAVTGEVLERAVSDSANQAIAERGMRPALEPKIEIKSYDEGANLEYTMAVEVLPEIEPMDFAKLELEKLTVKVPDDEVEKAIAEIAGRSRDTRPIAAPRKSQAGDVVVVDFIGRIDGKEFAGGAAEGYHLELGSGAFIPGFEDQLVGLEPGAATAVKVTFPETYGNAELKGKDAEFAVTLKEIREAVPAEINEDFAKQSGFDTLEAMTSGVREALQGNYEQLTRGRLKRQLLDKLADAHAFELPQGMVDAEFQVIWQQIEQARERGELDDDDKAKSEDELKAEYRDIARRRVKLGLLLSEVGQRNGIEVTEQEVLQAIVAEARRHPGHEREVMEIYQKNAHARANLRAPLFENKVVEYILELADVSERAVTTEELLEPDDEPTPAKSARKAKSKAAATADPAGKKGGAKTKD